jgi:hypothetical protein
MSLTAAEMMAEAIDPAHALWRDHGKQGTAVPVLSVEVLSSNNRAHNLSKLDDKALSFVRHRRRTIALFIGRVYSSTAKLFSAMYGYRKLAVEQ